MGEISSGRGGIGDPGSLCAGEWGLGGVRGEISVFIGGGRVLLGETCLSCRGVVDITGTVKGREGRGGRGAILCTGGEVASGTCSKFCCCTGACGL